MQLKILLPDRIFLETASVSRIVVRTGQGLFGILPHRLDCVAAVKPGIFTYETNAREVNLAVDEGILIKEGQNVVLSARNVIAGDLSKLKDAVEQDFLSLGDRERQVRAVLVKLESSILRRFAGLRHE